MKLAHAMCVFAATLMVAWFGCSDDETAPNDDGAGATGGMATTTTTGAAGMMTTTGTMMTTCIGAPDGECNKDAGEDCSCADCADTGFCVPGNCDAENGECHIVHDSCVCPDCDLDSYCSDPADGNCTNNGTCEPYLEGCNCEDCYTYDKCTDNIAVCDTGAIDDVCGATENCICPDCMGTVRCVPCDLNGDCNLTDSCLCSDCTGEPFCDRNCEDDSICAALYEGCSCADCAGETECGAGGNAGNGGSAGNGGN